MTPKVNSLGQIATKMGVPPTAPKRSTIPLNNMQRSRGYEYRRQTDKADVGNCPIVFTEMSEGDNVIKVDDSPTPIGHAGRRLQNRDASATSPLYDPRNQFKDQ